MGICVRRCWARASSLVDERKSFRRNITVEVGGCWSLPDLSLSPLVCFVRTISSKSLSCKRGWLVRDMGGSGRAHLYGSTRARRTLSVFTPLSALLNERYDAIFTAVGANLSNQRMSRVGAHLPLMHAIRQDCRSLHHVEADRAFRVFLLSEVGEHALSIDVALSYRILTLAKSLDEILDVDGTATTRR